MKDIVRNTLAAMAGAVTGIVLISLIQLLSARLYPVPEGLDRTNAVAMGGFMRTLPAGAFLLVLLSYLVGGFGGALAAGKLSLSHGRRQAVMVAVLFAFASLMNLLSFPHPAWFWIANFAAIGIGGCLALRLLPKGSG
ncbi:MAG: hypothetical protein C0502_06950 [Opitutus sp.]|nr:hypothetical protein [Opitutus sp.]